MYFPSSPVCKQHSAKTANAEKHLPVLPGCSADLSRFHQIGHRLVTDHVLWIKPDRTLGLFMQLF